MAARIFLKAAFFYLTVFMARQFSIIECMKSASHLIIMLILFMGCAQQSPMSVSRSSDQINGMSDNLSVARAPGTELALFEVIPIVLTAGQ